MLVGIERAAHNRICGNGSQWCSKIGQIMITSRHEFFLSPHFGACVFEQLLKRPRTAARWHLRGRYPHRRCNRYMRQHPANRPSRAVAPKPSLGKHQGKVHSQYSVFDQFEVRVMIASDCAFFCLCNVMLVSISPIHHTVSDNSHILKTIMKT